MNRAKEVVTTATIEETQKQAREKLETMSKHEMVEVLSNFRTLHKVEQNPEILDEIENLMYSFSQDQRKVTKAQMSELLFRIIDMSEPVEKPAPQVTPTKKRQPQKEASLKPKKAPEVEKPAPKKEKPPVQEVVKTASPATNVGKDVPVAKIFPKVIDHPELGKLVSVPEKYHTYKELVEALDSGKSIFFVCYWTKRQLKQFGYAAHRKIDPARIKNGFPLDLDILMAVVPCETMERVFAMSRITEAMFQFEGDELKPIEDKDGDETFYVRVSVGMEFEIYVPEAEVTTKK